MSDYKELAAFITHQEGQVILNTNVLQTGKTPEYLV